MVAISSFNPVWFSPAPGRVMSITPARYDAAPSLQPTFEEGLSVKRKAVLLALTTAVAVVVWQNYPDLVRYIKISQM
jgi:hypothetical protein